MFLDVYNFSIGHWLQLVDAMSLVCGYGTDTITSPIMSEYHAAWAPPSWNLEHAPYSFNTI